MNEVTFSDFKDFFNYHIKKMGTSSNGEKVLTLNELSKKIGYKSSSLLSMISTGKRLPSSDILEVLFEEWGIAQDERQIIRLRLDIEKRIKKNRPAAGLIEKLEKIDRKSKYKTIDIAAFNSIREWYNLVLHMLVTAPNFKEDYTQISYLLKRKVTPREVRRGIETLIKSGMLKRRTLTGELMNSQDEAPFETTHDIFSEAIREHHRGMISRALESIDEDEIGERHLNGLTLKFDRERNAEAKKFILDFVKDFNDRFYDQDAENISQLNVQFFSHTGQPRTIQ